MSRIHFEVHPGLDEIQRYAREKGWLQAGFTELSIAWLELRFTTDGWKTTQTLKSTEVPSPVVDGWFSLADVPKGTAIEFAVHAGVACRSPSDAAGVRERGETWLNNGGKNYTQLSR